MGVVIRYVMVFLEVEVVDYKVVFFLIDGEFFDIDVVEDDYLVEDVCEVVVSGLLQWVRMFCVIFDCCVDYYVCCIFGQWNFLIVECVLMFVNNMNRMLIWFFVL